jgi:hypothetical protein
MGYRGKVREQEQARALRAQAWTLADIAARLGVSKSSVSLWVRDIDVTTRARRAGRRRAPNRLERAKQEEISRLRAAGRERIGRLNDRDLLVAGVALYAGEGGKRDGAVQFSNSNPAMVNLFCVWFRRFFCPDEARLRVRLYLHVGLDLTEATAFWSNVTGIPSSQFGKAYRAVADPSIRLSKHRLGCATVVYNCSRTHREVVGLVDGLLHGDALPR